MLEGHRQAGFAGARQKCRYLRSATLDGRAERCREGGGSGAELQDRDWSDMADGVDAT